MSYYVYAIHTDETSNRLYGKYDDFQKAEEVEKNMRAGNWPGDNYFVRLIRAETDTDAEAKADKLRPYPQKP